MTPIQTSSIRSVRRRASKGLVYSLVLGALGFAALPVTAVDPPSLWGRWEFDDPADLGKDSSKNALHAEVHGAKAAEGRRRAVGGASGAAAFDGTGAFLEIPKARLLGRLSNLTIEAWVFGRGEAGTVFSVPGSLDLENGAFQLEQMGDESPARISTPVPAERWYHLAAVFDASDFRLYVDGRLVAMDILQAERLEGIAAAPWIIGGRLLEEQAEGKKPVKGKLEKGFHGLLDEVVVYQAALSASEILKHARERFDWPKIVVETRTGDAIQAAMDQAHQSGAEVVLPAGDYLLNRALVPPSGVMLRGEGAVVLKPEPTSEYRVSPAIILNGVDGVTLRDFTLDGQASVLEQRSGHLGILISGSSHLHLDGVTVTNLGLSREQPGGTHLRIESREPDDPQTMRGIPLVTGKPSEHNVIENCRFMDPEHKAALGVRVMTGWRPRPEGTAFTAPIRKTILRRNLLRGFAQTAMQVAGPATRENLIRGNTSVGAYLTAIETDKGASFNTFEDNRVQQITFPEPVVVAGMRDQGAYPDYWAEGNVFRGNMIFGVTSEKWAVGILLSFAKDGVFQDNTVRGLSGANEEKAAGIAVRGDKVHNYVHTPNTIDELYDRVRRVDPPGE